MASAAHFGVLAAGLLWPQVTPFPDAGKLSVARDGAGYVRVTGALGAIPGAFPVLVVDPNSGAAALANSDEDGAFQARLPALPGSWLVVKYDPTAGGPYPRWIQRAATPVSDVAMVTANTAPGTWLRVPPETVPSSSTFAVASVAGTDGIDYTLTGTMTGDLRPGGSAVLEGTATLYVSPSAARALAGKTLATQVELRRLFDEKGRARAETGFYFSNILTPTGLPVETKGRAIAFSPRRGTDALADKGGGVLTAPFRWTAALPEDLPAGTYAFAVRAQAPGARGAALRSLRATRQTTMTRDFVALRPFAIGEPAPPRLVWTLMTDVPGADGSRGTIAEEDRGDFELAAGIVSQARDYVVSPDTYTLEPYLPMAAQGDRHAPNPPPVAFRFPSGGLTARVRRPDGRVDVLGPAPFRGARSRAPATSSGLPLNNASGSLVDVLQLTTASGLFDYRFDRYGRYEIELEGSVEDEAGGVYKGGGHYAVFVAKRLDLETATLPMTPFQVGDALNPGVSVLPGVPADVEVRVELYEHSDPNRVRRWTVKGRANRFGYFAAKAGQKPVAMTAPGELVVETTARYRDRDGALWMGSTRWGQVVETPGAPMPARGRRGRHDTNPGASLWFESSRRLDSGHMRYPYAPGDVIWETDEDCIFPTITVDDREGRVKKSLAKIFENQQRDAPWETPFEERARLGELPLPLVADGPLPPAARPEAIRVHGYSYAAAERPGERVREVVSDDQGVQNHGYWLFNEPYAMQAGIGAEGDLPGDFKFLYGGAVFRDRDEGLDRYGIYGSLWVHLPDDDPRGSRVFPPFEGAGGGPTGGPLMTLKGEDVEGFLVPLAARPGSVLETGDTFSLSAALAPTLGGRVEARISGPDGFERKIEGRANAIGWFYRPDQDFKVKKPGLYRVSLEAVFDAETSAGPMSEPFPRGSVLGASKRAFEVYVVDRKSPRLGTGLPAFTDLRYETDRVDFLVDADGPVHYTIAMPGFLLDEGEASAVSYRPTELKKIFPNIDVRRGRTDGAPGLADTVWVGVLGRGKDGRYRARHFTLQGPELHAP